MDLVDIIVDWYLFFYVAKRDQFHYQIMFLIDIKMLLPKEMGKKTMIFMEALPSWKVNALSESLKHLKKFWSNSWSCLKKKHWSLISSGDFPIRRQYFYNCLVWKS